MGEIAHPQPRSFDAFPGDADGAGLGYRVLDGEQPLHRIARELESRRSRASQSNMLLSASALLGRLAFSDDAGDASYAQKVVDAIATTSTDGSDRPTDAVVIESITIT